MKGNYSKSVHNKPRRLNTMKSFLSFEIINTGIFFFFFFQNVFALKLGKTPSSRQRFCFALSFIYSPPSAVNLYISLDGLVSTSGIFLRVTLYLGEPVGRGQNTRYK